MFDKFRGGVVHEQYKEGTHPRIPFFQEPHIIDIRAQPREIKTITGTKDLQQVSIYLRVLSRPMPEKLSNIYQDLGLNFGDRLLPSLCNEPLKAIVAKYSAEVSPPASPLALATLPRHPSASPPPARPDPHHRSC